MTWGICNLSVVSMYTEPSHRSALASQVLFGEHFEVLETKGDWARIRLAYDGYDGWVLLAHVVGLERTDFAELSRQEMCISYDLVQIAIHEKTIVSLVLGSSLPHYKDKHCRVGELLYSFEGNARFPERLESSNTILENAYMYYNSPYQWGGRTPFGIDCSGFTQMVFKLSGIRLRRDAWMQAEQGQTINLIEESRAGDIAFFGEPESRISHAGIVMGSGRIMHASGRVRIDALDHHGIYNGDTKRYTHQLRLIKRLG